MTSLEEGELRLTVKVRVAVPLSPSVTLGESMDATGVPSSSVMVPVPVPAAMVAFAALPSVSTTVSFDSSVVSEVTETEKVLLVSPATKVRVVAVTAV